MTTLRRLIVLLSLAVIAWWGAAQFDLLRPQYHPVPVLERLLFVRLMPALAERMAERDISLPPVPAAAAPAIPGRPANTPIPNPTATPAAVPEPAAALPPTVAAVPTAAPTPTPLPTLTPIPTATPLPSLARLHLAEKEYMLELINAERVKSGVPPVVLGSNIAAQIHAETSLENCTASHWGVDGLKPYMRYSLAGGYQSNGENWAGLGYCVKASDYFYAPLTDLKGEIREIMAGWMDSPGHRDNILNRWHKKVNIGLAWDRYNLAAAQHFEGDYVEYLKLPSLDNGFDDGYLTLYGHAKNGIQFGDRDDLGIQVYYDPPPHPLTRGQLALTYCYHSGVLVAALRPPLTARQYYREDEFVKSYQTCPDPYEIPAGVPAPNSPEEANEFWQAAYDASQNLPERRVTVPWITALEWTAEDKVFSAVADLSGILAHHGPGVYTIAVWHQNIGGGVVISEHSIFYGIDPPAGYAAP